MEKGSLKTVKSRSFERPDDRMDFKGFGNVDILKFDDGLHAMRAVLMPGWRWSIHEKPLMKTETCEVAHTGYCARGSLMVMMEDGHEYTIKTGEFFEIPSGHDAWVLGHEPCDLILMSLEGASVSRAA